LKLKLFCTSGGHIQSSGVIFKLLSAVFKLQLMVLFSFSMLGVSSRLLYNFSFDAQVFDSRF
jgi:hypothetical protein